MIERKLFLQLIYNNEINKKKRSSNKRKFKNCWEKFNIYIYISTIESGINNVRRCNRLFALKNSDLVQFLDFLKDSIVGYFWVFFWEFDPTFRIFWDFCPSLYGDFWDTITNCALCWPYFLENLRFLAIIVWWFWHVGGFRVRFWFF